MTDLRETDDDDVTTARFPPFPARVYVQGESTRFSADATALAFRSVYILFSPNIFHACCFQKKFDFNDV